MFVKCMSLLLCETASTLFAYYIGRYFSLWLTPENEKSFESPARAKQFARFLPQTKMVQHKVGLIFVFAEGGRFELPRSFHP